MDRKNSFLVYTDYIRQIELLTMEQRGQLLTAMMQYALEGEIKKLELDPVTAMAFSFIQAQMARDDEKYQSTLRARKEAGAKGGRPSKKKEAKELEKAKEANGFSEKQIKAKKHDNDNVNDNDNDEKKRENTRERKTKSPPLSEQEYNLLCQEFDKNLVDRKIEKAERYQGCFTYTVLREWCAEEQKWRTQQQERWKKDKKVTFSVPNRFFNFKQRNYSEEYYRQLEIKALTS